MTTLTDVATFITNEATEDDIDRIYDFCKTRNKTLRTVRAASVQRGAKVELAHLSPKYLNGLRGVVETIAGERCGVRLDDASTDRLRFSGTRYYISPDTTEHLLDGVPLSSCTVLD